MNEEKKGGPVQRSEGRAGLRRPDLHLFYLLALPPVAIWILHTQKWKIPVWMSIAAAIGILVTIYLRAALFATEEEDQGFRKADWLWFGGIVVLVGFSAMFDWRLWIVEQFLLEIAAFSSAVALIAIRKAAEEGGIFQGPWLMVLAIFVGPAAGLVVICVKALRFSAGDDWNYLMAIPLAVAFGFAVYGATRKLAKYTIGTGQLREPFGGGFAIVLLVIWFVAHLIGIPVLLSGG